MMSLNIEKAVNLQVAKGLRDMNIPQDVIGNRERWDWIHHAPKRLKRIISLPNKNAVLEKQQVTFPYLPGLQKSLSVRKCIKTINPPQHFDLPLKK